MIYKRCDHCGRMIPPGTHCPCITRKRNKEYDAHHRDKARKSFYQSREWLDMREEILMRDSRVDRYLLSMTGEVEAATMVHHITPLGEDWSRRLDPSNLISLSDRVHKQIHKLYESDANAETRERLFEIIRDTETY